MVEVVVLLIAKSSREFERRGGPLSMDGLSDSELESVSFGIWQNDARKDKDIIIRGGLRGLQDGEKEIGKKGGRRDLSRKQETNLQLMANNEKLSHKHFPLIKNGGQL